MKRGILIGGGVVVVVIVAGVFFFLSSLDSIIQAAVEKVGSAATGAKVTLNQVEISTTSGKGALRGLTVGNPQGFHTDSAFSLGEVSVSVDTGSITSDPVIIKEVVIAAPKVTYELGGSGSNVDAIQKNVEAYSKQFGGGGAAKSDAAPEEGGGPKLIIENLYIRDGKVNVSATFLKGKKLGASLPDIHLKDIGKESGGSSPADVAKKVIDAIGKGASNAVASLDLGKMMEAAGQMAKDALGKATGAAAGAAEAAKSAVSGVTEGTSGATEATKDAVSGATDAAKEGMEKATGGLKKLLGN